MIDFLSEIFGGKKSNDISPRISTQEFESNLFQHGVYYFDANREAQELQIQIDDKFEWYKNSKREKKSIVEGMEFVVDYNSYTYAWRRQFDGQIPATWIDGNYASEDFEQAGKLNIQLSEGLVDAGATHPNPYVGREVGKTQKLNTDQLIALLAHPIGPEWIKKEVLEAQLAKGVPRKELDKAFFQAQEIKERVKDRKNTGHVEDQPPRLSSGKHK
jgi:hypothetical protein